MNEAVLKPFPCKEIDCGMSFFTEDHLSVHYQAKHCKLNLEIPKGSNIIFGKAKLEAFGRSNGNFVILADQTPTPTRLLNNCEELRVFDDLQNINPFEEGFRRAVEDGSNGLCFLTTPSNQDTLHTPQILPQFEHRLVKKEPVPIQDEPENLTLPTTLDDSNNIPKTSELLSSNVNDLKNYQKPPIHLLPKPSIIYAAPITPSAIQFVEHDANKSNESVKDRLKNIILSNSGLQIDRKQIKTEHVPIFIGTVPLVTTSASLIINNSNNNGNKFKIESVESNVIRETNVNVAIQKSGEGGGGSRKRARVEKSDSSTLKVERNRAAARRYR